MIRVVVKSSRRWSPAPWWKRLLTGALAYLLAGIDRYGELLADIDDELGARGIWDLTE